MSDFEMVMKRKQQLDSDQQIQLYVFCGMANMLMYRMVESERNYLVSEIGKVFFFFLIFERMHLN